MPRRPRLHLAYSTALVTGATGGIGDAIARALSARGVRLMVSGRREAELSQLAEDLGATTVVCDLAVAAEVDRLAQTALDAGVDVLVANAAHPGTGMLAALSQEEVDLILDVNLRAPIELARVLAPRMVARGRGHLVFISSLSGKSAQPASSLYSATKFGLRGFGLALREDLRGTPVGVSVVAPGFIRDAGMFVRTGVKLPPGVGTRTPQDVAGAVINAIEDDRAEIDVAPLSVRLGSAAASVLPGPAGWVSSKLGSGRIASEMDAGHRRHSG
ncbi:MAG TPA: SDR family NAD(P)-dependent oxidoreductase [Solirubrobacteraceae bacterium]|nr:SDR family NAD(P)-dependent oxidoreductase [Solirubrobacteraceae bacterium]